MNPAPRRPSAWRFHAGLLGIALVVFGGLAAFMRAQQALVVPARVDNPAPRPIAAVTSALRSMKLVTVELDTTVSVERGDTSWRGDVSAKLTVPVRLSYGTDLSKMTAESIGFSSLAPGQLGSLGYYVVRVPRPSRIATQTFSEQEQAEVHAGGMRLRTRAGEYYLGLARRDASPAARDLGLDPEDAIKVEETTREQVEQLVRTIVGKDAGVRVVFEDPN